jgi:DNA invertase Pin-like site-specific DNA recombinase
MRIPAAQYLRMSTERQEYSIDNQKLAIQAYAGQRGFEIIQTYEDWGRSGVVLKTRAGLCDLLRDVIGHRKRHRAILVYDVSRWGRFQDVDEAAHYEFICRRCGVPVFYCAEAFENDGTQASVLLKTMKRVMAAEFSRQLGSRVFERKKFWVGEGVQSWRTRTLWAP